MADFDGDGVITAEDDGKPIERVLSAEDSLDGVDLFE